MENLKKMDIEVSGAAIAAARAEKNLTRDTLLVRLNVAGIPVASHTLRNWEQGKLPKQITLLAALCRVLDLPITDVVKVKW